LRKDDPDGTWFDVGVGVVVGVVVDVAVAVAVRVRFGRAREEAG
jgi:hypothetical protein